MTSKTFNFDKFIQRILKNKKSQALFTQNMILLLPILLLKPFPLKDYLTDWKEALKEKGKILLIILIRSGQKS